MSKELAVPASAGPLTTPNPFVPAAAGAAAAALHLSVAGLVEHVGDLMRDVEGIFDQIGVAEEEIAAAAKRHPHAADRLWHSFMLLLPTQDRMATEFVYRSHCRELLDRLARDEDTRLGTAAEACCALLRTSMLAPLRSSAVGLYQRMWMAAGFPAIAGFAEDLEHHEALQKTVIDDNEQFIRGKLSVASRRLVDVTCDGRHHGKTVACRYAKADQLALTG